jgi:HD-GYP domain-containing protein (c-di-GMP phosphodiesterase class II)
MAADDGYAAMGGYLGMLSLALGERDLLTQYHSDRVVRICDEFGRHLGLTGAELTRLRLCAAAHDIGKIGIPDGILGKPGVLDKGEWRTMQTHPERGERLVLSVPVPGAGEIGSVVRHHHEHFDGSGYPDALAGEAIPLFSRLVAIADGYDAMATPRSYHGSREHGEIMEVMAAETGFKYDPALFDRFAEVIEDSGLRAIG